MKFTDIDLHPKLLSAIQEMGLEKLTEIQEKVLGPALQKRNIAGIAQTGTGKTIAFLLPIINCILTENLRGFSALIITPTRELCLQISEEARKLCKHQNRSIEVCSLFGGEPYRRQEAKIQKKPPIVVATPGRLIDYIRKDKFPISEIRFIVLDEADRMFDMGFINDVRFITRQLAKESQRMLFSATLSRSIMGLARDLMPNMIEVRVKTKSITVDRIDQSLVHLGASEKDAYIVNQIRQAKEPRIIVFTNYRHRVNTLTRLFRRYGITAIGISSLLRQKSRINLLSRFKAGECSVLVATDIASRGLDIDNLSHVINYNLPQDAEAYVHRIGRTARAGNSGASISYCCEEDYDHLVRIERYIRQKIPVAPVDAKLLEFPKSGFQPLAPLPEARSQSSRSSSYSQRAPSRRNGRSSNYNSGGGSARGGGAASGNNRGHNRKKSTTRRNSKHYKA